MSLQRFHLNAKIFFMHNSICSCSLFLILCRSLFLFRRVFFPICSLLSVRPPNEFFWARNKHFSFLVFLFAVGNSLFWIRADKHDYCFPTVLLGPKVSNIYFCFFMLFFGCFFPSALKQFAIYHCIYCISLRLWNCKFRRKIVFFLSVAL